MKIENRPLLPSLLLLFWLAEVAVGLLFCLGGARLLGPSENGAAAALIVMGLVLAIAGVVMTGLTWRISRIRGPAVEMTTEGLLDRRLSDTRIPWDSIRWKLMFNGRSYAVQFDLTEPQRRVAHIFWHQRAMGLFNQLIRHPEFTVTSLGTGLNAHQIGALMEGFRAEMP